MSTFRTLIILASAITVAQMYVGVNWRRANGSRRWVFVVGGILNSLLVVPVGFMAVRYVRGIDSVAILIVAGIVLFLSLVALRHGLRGRRVGDHPHCRRCRFDLFGKPETSTQCPECGANLDADHATVIGVRERRPALIFLSLFLMLVSLGVGVPVWWEAFGNQTNWHKFKPDWWLVMQWDPSMQKYPRSRSMQELSRRLTRNELSESARRSLMNRIIAQGTSGGHWGPELISSAQNRPTDESLLRALVRMNCSASFTTEDEVPIGRAIPNTTTVLSWFHVETSEMRIVRDEINGIEIPSACRTVCRVASGDSISENPEFLDLGALWQRIAPESNPDGEALKWKRDIEINVTFRNGDQKLSELLELSVTRDLVARKASQFASEATTAPWHARLRRAGTRAWIELNSDDGLVEGQSVNVSLTLTDATKMKSVQQSSFSSIQTHTKDGAFAAIYLFSTEKWSQTDELIANLNFSPSLFASHPETNATIKIRAITVPVADPGRKLLDPE